jgi:hypothetical protein
MDGLLVLWVLLVPLFLWLLHFLELVLKCLAAFLKMCRREILL